MGNDWKHGYYADSGYTYGYYAETAPLRLAWAAMIQGHKVPTSGFRYLDAGCGQGLNLVLMAAAHPESEFVGIDFLPEHVAHANELARSCALKNVRFIEGDFVELEKYPDDLGQYDYVVCHGISTWIAPQVKKALFALVAKVLRPGGLFYNSYNTFPGWLSTVPFQHLVLLEQRTKLGTHALKSCQESMEALQESGAAMFQSLPGLSGRIKNLEKQDASYLLQEYNNQHWKPVFVSQMMDDMAEVKFTYLGTATLPEAFDSAYSVKLRGLMNRQSSPVLREQIRDMGINQSFRRDLYVKGRSQPWSGQQVEQLRAFRFALNPTATLPPNDEKFLIKAGAVELAGESRVYKPLLEKASSYNGGTTVGELVDSQERNWTGTVAALSMLLHGGWLTLQNPDAETADGQRLNEALASAVCSGAPYRYISLPRAGGAALLSDIEWFAIAAIINQTEKNEVASQALAHVKRLGRKLLKDNSQVADDHEQLQLIQGVVNKLSEKRLEFYREMGAFQ